MTESNNSVENSTTQPMEASESPDLPSNESATDAAQSEEQPVDESSTQDATPAEGDAASESTDSPVAFDSLELEPEEENSDEAAREGGSAVDSSRVDALTLEVQSLKTKLEEQSSQYLRITADFENFRKRTRKEQEELDERSKCNTILELLPVIDNFERARTQLKAESEEAVNIHKSYQGIYKQLVECLKRIGVVPMRAKGNEFDPMLHEAVMREPSNEFEDGTVIEELQRGYILGERVLRHAMVKVAVAGDPPSESSSEEENSTAEG